MKTDQTAARSAQVILSDALVACCFAERLDWSIPPRRYNGPPLGTVKLSPAPYSAPASDRLPARIAASCVGEGAGDLKIH